MLIRGVGSAGRAESTLVRDFFTDSSGTALTTHTPNLDSLGLGWTAGLGAFDIEANRAELSAGVLAVNNVLIDSGSSVYTVTADIFTGTKAYVGLTVRAASSNTNIECFLGAGEDQIFINRNDAGTRTTLNSTAFTVDANTLYAMSVRVTTATVSVSVGGTTMLDSTNFQSNQTQAGLFTWDAGASGSYFDNFVITR